MSGPRPGEDQLLDLLSGEARGPRRHALFASWLVARVCLDATGPVPISDRNHRRRLAALRKRLGTLTLSVAFRRALHDIIEHLGAGTAAAAESALDELSRVVHDSLGDRTAAAVTAALVWVRAGGEETAGPAGRTRGP